MPHLDFKAQVPSLDSHLLAITDCLVDRIVSPAIVVFTSLLAEAGDAAPGPAGPAGPQGNFFQQMLASPLFPIAGVMFLFYFLYLAPEKRRKAEEAARMSQLTKNDRVVTIGGIHGTVASVPKDGDVITLKLDDSGSLRMKVSRSAIATIVKEKKDDKSAGHDKESA